MENTKRLYRSRKDRILGGVCGGIGNYFNIDPVLIRLLLVALILIGGWVALAYLVAWIIIPGECCKIDNSCCKTETNKAENETENEETK